MSVTILPVHEHFCQSWIIHMAPKGQVYDRYLPLLFFDPQQDHRLPSISLLEVLLGSPHHRLHGYPPHLQKLRHLFESVLFTCLHWVLSLNKICYKELVPFERSWRPVCKILHGRPHLAVRHGNLKMNRIEISSPRNGEITPVKRGK